jgi:hypothetical protein
MREFMDCTRENDALVAVDWHDPSDIAIQREVELGIDDEDDSNPDVLALKRIPSDALLVLLRFLISENRSPKQKWRIAQLRLAVLAHQAGLAGVGNLTMTELAEHLGCSKALISHYATRLVDQLAEAQTRGGKSRHAREVYRQTATDYHRRAGHAIGATKERRAFTA